MTKTRHSSLVERVLVFFLVCSDAVLSSTAQDEILSAGKLRQAAEEAMVQNHDYAAAIKYLQQAATLEPESALNHFKLFKVRQRQRSYVDALNDIRRASDLDGQYRPQKAKLLVMLGQCDRAVVEYQLYREWLKGAAESEKISKEGQAAQQCSAVIQAADAAFVNNDYERAAALYNQALQFVELTAPDLVFPKAQSLFFMEDYYGVISETGKLLKADGKNVEAYTLRGNAYHKLGEHEQAIKHYREGLKWDPEHKECKIGHKTLKLTEKKKKKGDTAFEEKNYEGAVEFWLQAAAVDETHSAFVRSLQLPLAKAYSKIGNHSKAIATAQAHIDEAETLDGLWTMGEILQNAEKYEEAVRLFSQAVDAAPDSTQEKQTAKKKLQEAQVALKQSKEKNYYKILGVSRNADKKEIKKVRLCCCFNMWMMMILLTCCFRRTVNWRSSGTLIRIQIMLRRLKRNSMILTKLPKSCRIQKHVANTIAVSKFLKTKEVVKETPMTFSVNKDSNRASNAGEGKDFTSISSRFRRDVWSIHQSPVFTVKFAPESYPNDLKISVRSK
jgi:DnaJ family protein C protein 3